MSEEELASRIDALEGRRTLSFADWKEIYLLRARCGSGPFDLPSDGILGYAILQLHRSEASLLLIFRTLASFEGRDLLESALDECIAWGLSRCIRILANEYEVSFSDDALFRALESHCADPVECAKTVLQVGLGRGVDLKYDWGIGNILHFYCDCVRRIAACKVDLDFVRSLRAEGVDPNDKSVNVDRETAAQVLLGIVREEDGDDLLFEGKLDRGGEIRNLLRLLH